MREVGLIDKDPSDTQTADSGIPIMNMGAD